MGLVIGTEGQIGDLCYLLNILHELPGDDVYTVLLQPSKVTGGGGIINAAAFVTDFVLDQPYIEDCRKQKPGERCDWNSGNFRGGGFHVKTQTLMNAHLQHLIKTRNIGHGIKGATKWLYAEPAEDSAGRVVINRTPRYQNPFFPWKKIVEHYGDLLLFVGTTSEHEAFTRAFGSVAHRPINTLKEMAQVIAGCELFIGNQSSPCAVAEGLKKPLIQEVSPEIPDCIYFRASAQHCDTGAVTLPAIGDRPELHISSPLSNTAEVVLHTTPPNDWQYQKMRSPVFINLVKECAYNGITLTGKELEREIVHENVLREPEFFLQHIVQNRFSRTETARVTAGYKPRTIREMIL